MNQFSVLGNLTRDPETVPLSNGNNLIRLRIASTSRYKEREETIYMTVKLFGPVTNDVTRHDVRKGRRVHITGRLVNEEWTDKDGNKKSELVLFGNTVLLLDNRRKDETPQTRERGESYVLATDGMEESRFDPDFDEIVF